MFILEWFKDEMVAARTIVSAMLIAVLGGVWDIWWHVMVGRESFFEPPHIMIYGGVVVACATGFFAWWVRREKLWGRIALALLAIPLVVAPLDEIWHGIFGFENLTSVWIVWSPPHVALDLALAAVLILLLPFVKRETEELRLFFGGAIFATLVVLFTFLTIPFDPEGQFHLLGWWGAVGSSAALTATIMYGARFLGGSISSLMIVVFYALHIAVGAMGEPNPEIIMLPHFDFPTWLVVFATLALALVSDAAKVLPTPVRGALAGAVWGAILYGSGSYFASPEFAYGSMEIMQAVVGAGIGGLVGGAIASRIRA